MLGVLAAAVFAAWGALVAELAVVMALNHGVLTTGWEGAMGTAFLLPAAFALGAPCGLFGGVLYALASQRAPTTRAILAVLAGIYGGAVTYFVTTGRHFEDPGIRVGAVGIAGIALAVAGYAAQPSIERTLPRRPRLVAGVALGIVVALEVSNRFVLVRLYPAFHQGLAVAVLALAPFVVLPLLPVMAPEARPSPSASRPRPLARGRGPIALLVGAILLFSAAVLSLAPTSERLSRFDNYRLLFLEQAPMLGHAVLFAATLAPPPSIEGGDPCELEPRSCPKPASSVAGSDARGPSFAGRDIVIVSIDALRADHVGAYGYDRKTTPNIDRLAAEGVVFEHAYCPTPHTSYSVTSMMTGKYMRPLLLQGAGLDSDTAATLLRTYGYKTAAFYPPAVFFIDPSRFEPFQKSGLGFEYRWVEFTEGEAKVAQVEKYLKGVSPQERLFLWVHLFSPHEPYEVHAEHPFGDRDVDRYDGEIAAADETLGAVVALVQKARPGALVVVTADHGEEFGEHGGRYHGTTVFEEQVRVPLVFAAPGLLPPRRVKEVVQTIDVLPTILSGIAVPPSPRVRGRDLGPLLAGSRAEAAGLAFAETEESALLAEGPYRLVCARKLGACRLYDIDVDAKEKTDIAPRDTAQFDQMRKTLSALGASHGRFETDGARTESGKGWPGPILRAASGDADAATDLASLLDDADRGIRRKAASLLFVLRRPETIPALRLALGRDEDAEVRNWCALALTRLGQTAPLVMELFGDPDLHFKRLAALALAESGDTRGAPVLIDWWQHGGQKDYEGALDLLAAFARLKTKDAVWPLVQSLGNVRLRPRIAATLASIGDDTARGPLVAALNHERYQTARIAIAEALVALKGKEELARPLIRFLGVPDPLPGGVGYAMKAGILEYVGGPDDKTLRKLGSQANVGVTVNLVVPRSGNGKGVRAIIRASAQGEGGEVRIGKSLHPLEYDLKGKVVNHRRPPEIHDTDFVRLLVPGSATPVEITALLPASLGAGPGRAMELVVYAERQVRLEGLALVPLSDELPPPPPKPWTPGDPGDGESEATP